MLSETVEYMLSKRNSEKIPFMRTLITKLQFTLECSGLESLYVYDFMHLMRYK